MTEKMFTETLSKKQNETNWIIILVRVKFRKLGRQTIAAARAHPLVLTLTTDISAWPVGEYLET